MTDDSSARRAYVASVSSCSMTSMSTSQHGANSRTPKILSLLAVGIVSTFSSLSEGMLAPFLPEHVAELGLDQSFCSGVIMAIQPITIVVSTPLATCLLAHFDHVGLLLGSLLLQAAAVLTFGCFGNYLAVMLTMRAAQGLGMAVGNAANYMLVVGIVKELGFVNALVEFTCGAGFAFGPVVGSVMYETGSFRLPFLVCGLSLAVVSVLAPLLFALSRRTKQLISSPQAEFSKEDVSSGEQQDENSFRRIWQISTFSFLLPGGVTLLSNVVWGLLQGGFYPIHVANDLKMTESAVGLNLGAASITMTLFSLLVGYISDRLGHERVMVCGLLMVALSLLLLGPAGFFFKSADARRWWEFAVMLSLGLGQAVTSIPGLAAMMKAVPEDSRSQEACSSVFLAFIQGGVLIGMLLSAAFGSHFVLGTILIASLMCCYALLWLTSSWSSSFACGSRRQGQTQQHKDANEPSVEEQTYGV